MSIPVIDIAALVSGDEGERARLAAEIGAACRGIGFFAITGHGVPQALIDDAFAASHELFDLPLATRREMAIERLGHNRGYVGLGAERLNDTAPADHKEAFNLIWTDERTRPPNAWPPIDGWRARVQAYFDAALAAARGLHGAFALDRAEPADADAVQAPGHEGRPGALRRHAHVQGAGRAEPDPAPLHVRQQQPDGTVLGPCHPDESRAGRAWP